jgi:SAM-dependent methyltransferase
LAVGSIAGSAAVAAMLRHRATGLRVLTDSGVEAEDGVDEVSADQVVITAAGVTVDDRTRRAACAHAVREQLDVLDLIPAGLGLERAVDVVAQLDPRTFRGDPLGNGRTAAHAMLMRRALADRLGLSEREPLPTAEFVRAAVDAKRSAPFTTEVVVSPWLPALTPGIGDAERLRAFGAHNDLTGASLALRAAHRASTVVLAGLGARWGAAALAARVAGPFLAFAGTPLRPHDLRLPALVRRPFDVAGALRCRAEAAPDRAAREAERKEYVSLLGPGPERFLEDRRGDCPICGSTELAVEVVTPDFLQGKPGTFTLERCGGCRHVFQNPRLTVEGLDYYYKDFWDGAGYEGTEAALSLLAGNYRARAEMLRAHDPDPRRWLDVGAGHGHFALFGRQVWPGATFDGLEMTDAIDVAVRLGRVDTGHRGMFPDLGDELADRYDVVTMHHYLEHTREPLDELDAAAKAVRRGGHLLIEVPDPEFPMRRVMRSYWPPWAQPQHQHFFSESGLTVELERRGFDVVEVHRGSAHLADELMLWAYYVLNRLAPNPARPWAPPPTIGQRARRYAAVVAMVPVFGATWCGDQLMAAGLRGSSRRSNTMRVLVRLR